MSIIDLASFTEVVKSADTLDKIHRAEFTYLGTLTGWLRGRESVRRAAIAALGTVPPERGARETDARYAARLSRALTDAFITRGK